MSGSATFEGCVRVITGGCGTRVLVEQRFVNDVGGASSSASGQQDGLRVAVKAQVSGLFLTVSVPVRQSTTVEGLDEEALGGHVEPVQHTKWSLGCPVVPDRAGEVNSTFWKDYGIKASYFEPLGRFEDPFPVWGDASLDWNDTGSELIFDCSRQWATFGSGSGSISYHLNGTLRWVRVDG